MLKKCVLSGFLLLSAAAYADPITFNIPYSYKNVAVPGGKFAFSCSIIDTQGKTLVSQGSSQVVNLDASGSASGSMQIQVSLPAGVPLTNGMKWECSSFLSDSSGKIMKDTNSLVKPGALFVTESKGIF